MEIYITRHSKTIWNQEHRLQGWQDSPLLEEGIEDAKALHQRIKDLPITICYSSPIKRAKETSQILFPNTTIQYDDRLKEMNFGDYEGCFVKDLLNKDDYYRLWHEPSKDLSLPNGETFLQVQNRLLDFIYDIYTTHSDDTIFLTMHGMAFIVLRAIMTKTKIEDMASINTVVRGCSLTKVQYDGSTFMIEYLGDEDHLVPITETISYAK